VTFQYSLNILSNTCTPRHHQNRGYGILLLCAQFNHELVNSAMGQIPCSTERISCYDYYYYYYGNLILVLCGRSIKGEARDSGSSLKPVPHQQQCRSNIRLCSIMTMLLRHCCWCGRGLRQVVASDQWRRSEAVVIVHWYAYAGIRYDSDTAMRVTSLRLVAMRSPTRNLFDYNLARLNRPTVRRLLRGVASGVFSHLAPLSQ